MKQIPNTHVTSLELSRRLKELGVPQTSQFYWSETQIPNIDYVLRYEPDIRLVKGTMFASAYLASELGELLPNGHYLGVNTSKGLGGWHVELTSYEEMPYKRLHLITEKTTEADARAKMLIYLLENHLISVEELGK